MKANSRRKGQFVCADPVSSQSKKIIALTGSVGSGKTSSAVFLQASLGASIISADIINRRLLFPQEAGWVALFETFGSQFLAPDKTVDRSLLRKALFADREFRQQINGLLHPLIRKEIDKEIAATNIEVGTPLVLVEVPLLFEADWQVDFETVIAIYARPSVCVARLMTRDGHSLAEAQQMVGAQMPAEVKAMLADHVIDNCGSWAETCYQLLQLSRIISDCYLR